MLFNRRTQMIVLGCILMFLVTLNTWLYVMQQVQEWWYFAYTDTYILAPMYQALIKPDTFPKDFLFRSNEYFKFYTPSFFVLLSLFPTNTPVIQSFAQLATLLVLVYIPCATLFFWVICRNGTVSLLMAVVSAVGFVFSIDFWQLFDISSALPRQTSNPIVMLIMALVFWFLKPQTRPPWWFYGVVGLSIGLCANLHPASAMGLALIVGLFLMAWSIRNQCFSWVGLGLFAVLVLVGALPILTTFVGNSSMVSTSNARDLSELSRYLIFPFGQPVLNNVIRILSLVVAIGAWWYSRKNQQGRIVLLVAVGLNAAMVDYNVIPLLFLVAFVAIAAYDKKLQSILFAYGEWLLCILIVCQVLPALLYVLIPSQASATIWGLELTRSIRFVNLPFFAMLAVTIAERENHEPLSFHVIWWGLAGLVIAFQWTWVWIFLAPLGLLWAVRHHVGWHKKPILYLLWESAWVALAVFIILRTVFSLYVGYTLQIAIFGSLVTAVTGFVQWRMGLPSRVRQLIILIAPILAMGISVLLRQNPTDLHKIFAEQLLFSFPFALIVAIGVVCILSPQSIYSRAVLYVFLGIVALQTGFGVWYQRYDFVEPSIPPHIQAARWAKANTPQDSLFYVALHGNYTHQSTPEFRIESLRSVSLNLNEIHMVMYAKSADVPLFEKRDAQQIESYKSADTLIKTAQEYRANYIIINANFLGYTLDLPIVFAQDYIIIYSLPA